MLWDMEHFGTRHRSPQCAHAHLDAHTLHTSMHRHRVAPALHSTMCTCMWHLAHTPHT